MVYSNACLCLQNATQKSQKVFVHVPSEIAAHEVEEIGIHLLFSSMECFFPLLYSELEDADLLYHGLFTFLNLQ